jgi:predicted dehydrogenase
VGGRRTRSDRGAVRRGVADVHPAARGGGRIPQGGAGRAFADRFAIPAAHGSYAELLADRDIDIVYIASPHSKHFEQASQAIEAGRHVLVEKAFTRNAHEAEQLVAAARER